MATVETPSEITGNIKSMASRLSPGQLPVFVDVTPEPESEPWRCFQNVAAHVERNGGEVVYGYLLWLAEDHFEIERHAVWRKSEVALIDLTPHAGGQTRVLFVPTPGWQYREGMLCSRTKWALDRP